MNVTLAEIALMPGCVDCVEENAIRYNDRELIQQARAVKYPRNALYCSIALTAIATIGATISAESDGVKRVYAVVAIAGLGAVIISAKRLYNAALNLYPVINRSE